MLFSIGDRVQIDKTKTTWYMRYHIGTVVEIIDNDSLLGYKIQTDCGIGFGLLETDLLPYTDPIPDSIDVSIYSGLREWLTLN